MIVGAKLAVANLSNANLAAASLTAADLSGANLSDAYVTEEQLATCKSLEGATMPNGQNYENWLTSSGREENRANSGPS